MKSTASVNGINPNSRNFPKLTWDASCRPSRRPLINSKTTKYPTGSRVFPAPPETTPFPSKNRTSNIPINERFHPPTKHPPRSVFTRAANPKKTLGFNTSTPRNECDFSGSTLCPHPTPSHNDPTSPSHWIPSTRCREREKFQTTQGHN